MSRQSAYGTVVASTTVSAVLALCIIGLGATAPAAASSVTSSATATGDEVATPVDIAAAIGASLDAGTQAGARTGGGFTRSFAGSALAASATDSTAAADAADLTSALSSLSTNSAFAAVASAQPSTTATSFTTATTDSASTTVPSVDLPSVNAPTVAAVAVSTISAVAPVAASVHVSVVAAAPALPVGSTRQVTQSLAANAGWSGAQWTCLSDLWQRESLFRTTARNYRSGAYGIPQALPASKMATAGADWRTNPATQVRWGLHYIATRYGNPCNGWAHWKRYRSY